MTEKQERMMGALSKLTAEYGPRGWAAEDIAHVAKLEGRSAGAIMASLERTGHVQRGERPEEGGNIWLLDQSGVPPSSTLT